MVRGKTFSYPEPSAYRWTFCIIIIICTFTIRVDVLPSTSVYTLRNTREY